MKRQPSPCRGFTLVELTASMAAASILVVGMASTMFTALRANDTAQTPGAVMLPALACLVDMSAELQFARSVEISNNSKTITVEVPDRDEDGAPEKICYEWLGGDKTSLTRKYNNGTAQDVIQYIHSMTVEYNPATTPGFVTVTIHPATARPDSIGQPTIVETSIPLLNMQ